MIPLALALILQPAILEDRPAVHLRLNFTAGTERVYRIEQFSQFGDSAGLNLQIRLREKVQGLEQGKARIERILEHVELEEGGPKNDILTGLAGVSWRGRIDDRGRWEQLALNRSEKMPKLLQPLLETLRYLPAGGSVILPESAVQVGQSWQVPAAELLKNTGRSSQRSQGQITCTLTALHNQVATIGLVLEASLGTDEDKRQGHAQGTGQLVINLADGFIQRFNFESTMKLSSTVAGRRETNLLRNRFQMVGESP